MGRPPIRVCSRGHDKDVTGRRRDGNCVECSRHYYRAYRAKNLKQQRIRERELKKRNPQTPRLEYMQAYRRDHKEQLRQVNTRWRQRNRLRLNESGLARQRRYTPLPLGTLEALLDYYGPACVYCGEPSTGFDHLQPLSRGGAHSSENLAPCCKPCNSRKKDRPIWVMLQSPPSRLSEQNLSSLGAKG